MNALIVGALKWEPIDKRDAQGRKLVAATLRADTGKGRPALLVGLFAFDAACRAALLGLTAGDTVSAAGVLMMGRYGLTLKLTHIAKHQSDGEQELTP